MTWEVESLDGNQEGQGTSKNQTAEGEKLYISSVPMHRHMKIKQLMFDLEGQAQFRKRGVSLCHSRQGINKLGSRTGCQRDFH